jgi:hypothetical protein
MRKQQRGDAVSASVEVGSNSGQVAIGNQVEQHQALGDAAVAAVSDAEREQLRVAFGQLRAQVAAHAPAEKRTAAVERVEELEGAVFADKPDVTTIRYVAGWFRTNLPALAGTVAGVVVHPIVGKLVQTAGELLAGDLRDLVDDPRAAHDDLPETAG